MRADFDVGKPAQSEHAKAQHVRQEFRPQADDAIQQFVAVLGVKIIRQPNIENQQRHRDGEDSIAERIETDFCEHDDSASGHVVAVCPWRRRKCRKIHRATRWPRQAPKASGKASGKPSRRARSRLARGGVI
jgi:hypothetical protein